MGRGQVLVVLAIAACGQREPAPTGAEPAPLAPGAVPAPAGPQLPPGPIAPDVIARGAQALARANQARCRPAPAPSGTFRRAHLAPLLALSGKAFVDAYVEQSFAIVVQDCELEVDDLWALVDKVRAAEQSFPEAWRYASELGSLTDQIAARSTARDFARLVELVEQAPASAGTAPALDAAIQLRLRETVAGLVTMRPPPIDVNAFAGEMPDAVRAADPTLRDAWARYRGLVEPTAAQPATTPIEVQSHWRDLDLAVVAMLRGEPADHIAALTAFTWGGGCGTGSDALEGPRGQALAAAHLAAGDHALAAGQLMVALAPMVSVDDDAVRRQYLSWLGLDWAQLYAGAVVDGRSEFLEPLGAAGGDAGARLLIAIDAFAGLDGWARERHVRALGEVVSPFRGTPASPDVQRVALQALAGHVRTGEHPDVVFAAVEGLASRAAETRADLQRALALPYERAAQRAASALQGLGETVATPAARPVRVEVTVDGNPLPNREVRWELALRNTSTSSTGTTDAEGRFTLDRDRFAGELPDRMEFGTGEIGTTDAVWFEVTMPGPSGIPDVLRVDVRTGAIAIDVADGDLPRGPAATDAPRALRLHRTDPPGGDVSIAFVSVMGIPLGPEKTITLPRLQRGTYQLELLWPGAAPWREQIEVGAGTRRVTAKLAPPATKP
jgi:hypothetical protein